MFGAIPNSSVLFLSVGFSRGMVGLAVLAVLLGCGDNRAVPMAMTPGPQGPDAALPPADGSPPPPLPDAAPPDAAPGACEVPIDIAGPGLYQGDTSAFASDHTASCSAGSAQAPDVAYRLDVGAVPVDVVIDGTVDETAKEPFDLVLSAVGDCLGAPESELGCMDRGLGEHLELLEVTGQITLVIDGTAQYADAPQGSYALNVQTRAILAPGTTCAALDTQARCSSGHRCFGGVCSADSPVLACTAAVDMTAALAQGAFEVEAATYPYAADHYQGGCVFDPLLGAGEDIYRFELLAPASLVASTDFAETLYDTALYLRAGDCFAAETACHDDVDLDASNLRSTLEVPRLEPGTYYLYVDGSSPPGTGRYRLRVTTTPLLLGPG